MEPLLTESDYISMIINVQKAATNYFVNTIQDFYIEDEDKLIKNFINFLRSYSIQIRNLVSIIDECDKHEKFKFLLKSRSKQKDIDLVYLGCEMWAFPHSLQANSWDNYIGYFQGKSWVEDYQSRVQFFDDFNYISKSSKDRWYFPKKEIKSDFSKNKGYLVPMYIQPISDTGRHRYVDSQAREKVQKYDIDRVNLGMPTVFVHTPFNSEEYLVIMRAADMQDDKYLMARLETNYTLKLQQFEWKIKSFKNKNEYLIYCPHFYIDQSKKKYAFLRSASDYRLFLDYCEENQLNNSTGELNNLSNECLWTIGAIEIKNGNETQIVSTFVNVGTKQIMDCYEGWAYTSNNSKDNSVDENNWNYHWFIETSPSCKPEANPTTWLTDKT